jgi:hypothetical protein
MAPLLDPRIGFNFWIKLGPISQRAPGAFDFESLIRWFAFRTWILFPDDFCHVYSAELIAATAMLSISRPSATVNATSGNTTLLWRSNLHLSAET